MVSSFLTAALAWSPLSAGATVGTASRVSARGAADQAQRWGFAPVAGTRSSRIADAVALPGGGYALLLVRSSGDELRFEEDDKEYLEIRVHGRTRSITHGHSFGLNHTNLAVDERGNLTAFWTATPDGRNNARGYLWERGRVRRFSAWSTVDPDALMAVAPDGSGIIAMSRDYPDEGSDVVFARRRAGGTFGPLQRSALNGLEAVAATSGGGVALVGPRFKDPDDVMSVQRSLSSDDPLSDPVMLSASDPRGTVAQRTALVMTKAGSIIAAYETGVDEEHWDRTGEHTVVRGVVWTPASPTPVDLPVMSPSVVSGQPAVLEAGDRVWAAWAERPPGDPWARSVAVTTITDAGRGPLMRLRPRSGTRLGDPLNPPLLTGSGVSGVRVSLARETAGFGSGVIVHTFPVDEQGTIGPLEVIAPPGRAYPAPISGTRTPVLGFTITGRRRSDTRVVIARPGTPSPSRRSRGSLLRVGREH